MNLCTILLVTFSVIFSIFLKGIVAGEEIYGLLGQSVLLRTPDYKGTPNYIYWSKPINSILKKIRCKPCNGTQNCSERCSIFSNGSLAIDKLQQDDSGDYMVEVYARDGTVLIKETTITLKVLEPLPQPQLISNCSKHTLICEVKSDRNRRLQFTLHQNNLTRTFKEPEYINGNWRVTIQQKNLLGKFKCEVVSQQIDRQQTEIEVNCPGSASFPRYMIYLLLVGGGVLFIILVAVIVYCIRRKIARRHEFEDQDIEVQARLAEDTLKCQKLPQPSVLAAPKLQQRPLPPPPPHPERQQQGGPPQPRPRPPQQKPPRRMKERS